MVKDLENMRSKLLWYGRKYDAPVTSKEIQTNDEKCLILI